MKTKEVWAIGDLPWAGTPILLKVAQVRKKYLKGAQAGQTITFWVLSQHQDLDSLSLRQLGHGRWFIENKTFKAANEQANTKHLYSHNPYTAMVIRLLQMLRMMLVTAYCWYLAGSREHLRSLWGHGSLSLVTMRQRLWMTLNLGVDTG